jgi:hypothetical protein
MKHYVTGRKANIMINGKPIALVDNVAFDVVEAQFDALWNAKYYRSTQHMIDSLNKTSNAYAHIYNLCEFLWRLGITKPFQSRTEHLTR